MKMTSYGIIILLLSVLLTGCGGLKDGEGNEQPLTDKEMGGVDLPENGSAKVRSLDDICVIPEPLVRRQIRYNESGEILQIDEYEYDSKNRYTQIRTSQRDPETDEILLCFIYTYSYDDSFYYVDCTHVLDNNIVTRDIYDMHDNKTYTQLFASADKEIATLTYTYEYICDTEYKEEENCYDGESKDFSHYAMHLYNENGDEIYYFIQYSDDDVFTVTTEYEYNEQNQIIHASYVFNIEDIFKSSTRDETYTYDENGALVEKIISFLNPYGDMSLQKISQYQYDEEGKMIREELRQISYNTITSDVGDEAVLVIVYEYDLDLAPLQQLQTVSKYPVTLATSAYKDLLEQETFVWDEHGSAYNTADIRFSLIGSENEDNTIYLLLQNEYSYAAAGTQHLLAYQEGEVKTLWGYGQNCIYIRGFAKDKETGEKFYFIASGGRQDVSYFYVFQLDGANLDLIAEQNSFPDRSSDEENYIITYYWQGKEVEEVEYLERYDELLDEEMIEITWLDNTKENRELIFEE